MNKLKSMITLALVALGITAFASNAQAATVTCVRTELKAGDSTNLVERFTYTAAPAAEEEYGGVFYLDSGATLTGTNVTFKDNETKKGGGAIYNKGSTVVLKDVSFKGNKALMNNSGGAINNNVNGTLSLDGVTFAANEAAYGGAIYNAGTVHFDGPVTLVTTNDTICSVGMLNWNLTDGKQGVLNGYQNVTNRGTNAKLRLTVEDFAAMPTNIVIATGDFTNVEGKDAFSITNVAGGAALTIKINGEGVATGTEPGNTLYRLVTEEDLEAGTTNLVLQVYEITVERAKVTGTTNLVAGTTYTAAPTASAGAFYVANGATLTGTNVTFKANEAVQNGGAIASLTDGTVALKNALFTGNKAATYGGAIWSFGTLSLDNVTFEGNTAKNGGAIYNGSSGTVHFDGPVTLVTETDTIYSSGILNWNLAGGKQGLLNGYDKLTNNGGTLRLTVEDYAEMPTNFVIATGDFTNVEGKDAFSMTNVTTDATAKIKIGGLALVDGTWWKLAIEKNELVLRNPDTVKLSDVEIIDAETGATNATAVATVNGVTVKPDEDGNYMIPKGYPVILNYTAQEDYVFQAGLTAKTVVLDPLTGDISMAETGYKPIVEPTWSETRIVAFDTRARIVVGNVNDVLPLAYSTNNWGEVTADQTKVFYFRDGEYVKKLVDTNENGYVEWQPTREEYGQYTFGQAWLNAGTAVTDTSATIYYSQPYKLAEAVDGNGTFDLSSSTLDEKEGTVLGYDFVDIVAKPAEGSEFVCWTLTTNGVEVVDAFEDARALTNRFEMPCTDTKILAKFSKLTGCTVNGQDIARGKGEGWEYTPATNGKMGTLQLLGDEIFSMTLSGKLPSHTKITSKASEEPMLAFINLENFTNDVSDCDAKVALTVPNFKDKKGHVGLIGTNYLAAGARASAINVVMQDVTFRGKGTLIAIPGTDETVLPAISCTLGTCKIVDGTYNDAVDPALVHDPEDAGGIVPHSGAFSNGDGTWSVKQYYQVTFDPVPPGERPKDYWMDVNDMTQRVIKGECAIPPAPPKCMTKLFTHWVNTNGQQEYAFTNVVKKDIKLQAAYMDSEAARETLISDFADPELRPYAAGDLSNAVDRVEEGGVVDVQKSGQVCNDIKKQMLVGYAPDCMPTVTVGEGLTAVDSRDNVLKSKRRGYGVIAIGELTRGAETNLVVVKGEMLPAVESRIKPEQGITPELIEKATNFVKTATAENLLALPTDAPYSNAVDCVKKAGGDAVVTRLMLHVEATGLEPGAKDGTLASVEMDVYPKIEVYSIKDGKLDIDPVYRGKLIGSDLSGEPVTVTFSVAALGQVPKLIVHEPSEGDVEYFYNPDDVKSGEKSFDYDPVAKTISFEMTEFSPVTVYFETEQFPVTLDAGAEGYFGAPGFTTRKVYESTIGTGKYRNLVKPTPTTDRGFGGWLYGTTNVANGVAFAVEGDHTLTAKWTLPEQTVTVLAGEGGTATGSGTYRIDTLVTVSATADADWQFAEWTGSFISGANPFTFLMPETAVSLTATFKVSDDYLAACREQVAAERAAALDELNALALTDEERKVFAQEIEDTAEKAIAALNVAQTPTDAKAIADGAKVAFDKTLDEATEIAEGRAVTFTQSSYETTEGEELAIAVFGGRVDRSTAVTLNFVKGTYTSKPTAYVDGKKVNFPITLDFARGEIGEKVVTLVTRKVSKVEEDRFFTLQLSASAGIELGANPVAMVTVQDSVLPTPETTDYVRALAWPANGGAVSGSGALKTVTTRLTLKATAKKYATFAGWYLAKTNDVNQIDLDNGPVSFEKNLKVGYGTEYGEGTYYAYFTDVLPVASVIDPDPTAETAEGIVYDDRERIYYGSVGLYVSLPIGLDDASGKGSLTVSSLPSGLKYDKKTGYIYGTPTKACEKEVKVVAKNAAGKQTVFYTFIIEALPANAVGTWNGVVRQLEDPEDGTHAGFGTVQFTASSSGKLSAKVTTRLTGMKSFSAKSYEFVDENTFGITMTTKAGEVFQATLYLTNDWKTAQLVGTVTGGKFEANGEEVKFAAIRNAFEKKDKNKEALEFLEEFKGLYEDTLYLKDEGEPVGTVTFRVKDGGKVQVKATSVNATYSTSCAGAFRATPAEFGAVQTAVRNGKKLWATDALLDAESGDVKGLACDYDTYGADTHETIGVPVKK